MASKKPISLLSTAAPLSLAPDPEPVEPSQDNAAQGQGAMPIAPRRPAPKAKANTPKADYEKLTVFVPKEAERKLRLMAIEHDKPRLNDLLKEALDLLFAKYGQPTISEIERKSGVGE